MKSIRRRLALAAHAGGLAFLLLLPLLDSAPAGTGCAQGPNPSCASEDLLRGDERYAASDEAAIVQIALSPRPMPPKHVGGGAALLENSGDRAKACRRCLRTVDLIAPDVPRGNPHAGAWRSRAPPLRAA